MSFGRLYLIVPSRNSYLCHNTLKLYMSLYLCRLVSKVANDLIMSCCDFLSLCSIILSHHSTRRFGSNPFTFGNVQIFTTCTCVRFCWKNKFLISGGQFITGPISRMCFPHIEYFSTQRFVTFQFKSHLTTKVENVVLKWKLKSWLLHNVV